MCKVRSTFAIIKRAHAKVMQRAFASPLTPTVGTGFHLEPDKEITFCAYPTSHALLGFFGWIFALNSSHQTLGISVSLPLMFTAVNKGNERRLSTKTLPQARVFRMFVR